MKVGEEEMLRAAPITNFSPAFFRVGEFESYTFNLLQTKERMLELAHGIGYLCLDPDPSCSNTCAIPLYSLQQSCL